MCPPNTHICLILITRVYSSLLTKTCSRSCDDFLIVPWPIAAGVPIIYNQSVFQISRWVFNGANGINGRHITVYHNSTPRQQLMKGLFIYLHHNLLFSLCLGQVQSFCPKVNTHCLTTTTMTKHDLGQNFKVPHPQMKHSVHISRQPLQILAWGAGGDLRIGTSVQ